MSNAAYRPARMAVLATALALIALFFSIPAPSRTVLFQMARSVLTGLRDLAEGIRQLVQGFL